MKKLSVNINDEPKDIEIKLKGRHTEKIQKLFAKITSSPEEELEKNFNEYNEATSKIACECTGLTPEEIGDMDSEDKNEILNYIQSQSMDQLTFLKSSLK